MTLKKRIVIVSIPLVFICAFLVRSLFTSSEPISEVLRSIFASQDNCTAPCWHTIIPGVTNEETLVTVINNFPSAEIDNFRMTQLQPEGTEYLWDNAGHDTFMRIRLRNDVVELIGFDLYHRGFRAFMIFDWLGQPDWYGATILGSESLFVDVTLIYESRGIVFETWLPISFEESQIIESACEFENDWTAATRNDRIYFVEPGNAEDMVHIDPIGNFENPNHYPQIWTQSNPIKLTMCR